MIEVIVIAVLIVVFVIGVFVVMVARERSELVSRKGKYPEGHFIALGLIFGVCVGLLLGAYVGSASFGAAIGLIAGALIGVFIEDRYQKAGRMRGLTSGERGDEMKALKLILIVVLSILVIVSAAAIIFGLK